jgi:hypothetical protein
MVARVVLTSLPDPPPVGAEIRRAKGGHVCALLMEGHPLHGNTFGAPGTIAGLIDWWVEHGRLPDHMRLVPKTGE